MANKSAAALARAAHSAGRSPLAIVGQQTHAHVLQGHRHNVDVGMRMGVQAFGRDQFCQPSRILLHWRSRISATLSPSTRVRICVK